MIFVDLNGRIDEFEKLARGHNDYYRIKEIINLIRKHEISDCMSYNPHRFTRALKYGHSRRASYVDSGYKEVDMKTFLGIKEMIEKDRIVKLLDMLTEDNFDSFCEAGQNSLLELCKEIDYEPHFVGSKEIYVVLETYTFEVPKSVSNNNVEVELIVKIDGKVVKDIEMEHLKIKEC